MKKMPTIKLVAIVLCMIMFFGVLNTAMALTGPLTESYYFSPDPGIGACNNIVSRLSNMGYDTRLRVNRTAVQVRSTMDDDAVFTILSHGAPGKILCAGGQFLTARISSPSENISLENLFAGTTLKLKKIRFAYYAACKTAATSSVLGNITTYTTNTLLAKSSMGFTQNIGVAAQVTFGSRLFQELEHGYNVSNAGLRAMSYTLQVHGDYVGHDSMLLSGSPGSTYVTPAKYGNE